MQSSLRFQELDRHLAELKQYKHIHSSPVLEQLPLKSTGILTLTGGILTGKTTLLKQWIAKLLTNGVPEEAITFLSGKLVKGYDDLIALLHLHLNKSIPHIQYVLIDDVTYIRHWNKAIKKVAEAGLLENAQILLSSADKNFTKKLKTRFLKQYQKAKKNDFNLFPLTFHEVISLKYPASTIDEIDLFKEFNYYLLHGGFLAAINDITMHGTISDKTLKTYSDTLQEEILKSGKKEDYVREIFVAIIDHYCKPVTWNMLSLELSISHSNTVRNYMALAEALDVVFVQPALLETTLHAAPKKARKLMFTDPFIFHAIRAWLNQPKKNAFENEIKPLLDKSDLCCQLVKACTITHYRHYYPTYYIKTGGDIDLVYIHEERIWPIVITWTNQLRAKDLRRILKYPNGKILTKSLRSESIKHIRTEPLPQALWKLAEKKQKIIEIVGKQ